MWATDPGNDFAVRLTIGTGVNRSSPFFRQGYRCCRYLFPPIGMLKGLSNALKIARLRCGTYRRANPSPPFSEGGVLCPFPLIADLALEASDRRLNYGRVEREVTCRTAPAYQQFEGNPDNPVVSSLSFSPESGWLRGEITGLSCGTRKLELITTVVAFGYFGDRSYIFFPDGRLLA